ncbi:hypothetical protein SAY86_023543 [Trapa natans]|uniref:Uncharacterized protein n=1 Tax=Trapa natans TaxID=22666 RepID=A0AAN7LQ41_TRANT|nr:hypothetical protein SAY86_023543 [Trapa natans]
MVCQAAGRTRFRALKHLHRVAGSATIIVRIIACFQPLRDCQFSVIDSSSGPDYSAPKEKLSVNSGNADLNPGKKFLVFDQTTVIVSSGPGFPFHRATPWTLNQLSHSAMDDGAI